MKITKRLEKLKEIIKDSNLDSALISSIPNIIYLTNYSGFSSIEREAFIFINQGKQFLLTDGRYKEAVEKIIKDFEYVEISHNFPPEIAVKELAKKENIRKLGIEENNLSISEFRKIEKNLFDLKNINLGDFRQVKEENEIVLIEKACKVTDKTFDLVLNKIKEGITEKHLAFKIELFIKEQGFDISFKPIVAFGNNSSIPHHLASDRKLKKGDIILLDFGAKVENYCSDITRTLFFGKANAEQKRMYQTVLDAQKKSIEFIKSSIINHKFINAFEVDKIARDYIVSQGFPTIPHSLGHGIGIEVHESPKLSPNSKDILKQKMVFSIEPGIYLPGLGGIRIEDLAVLEKKNLRIFTKSSKKAIEL